MEKLKITNTHFYLCFYNITVLLLLLTSLVVFAEEELEPKSNLLYDSQLSTLLSIKSSLIDPFNNLSDWKPVQTAGAPPYCNWTGISCDPQGFVRSLDLSNMNLTGNISGDIQGLRRTLRFLNLSCNGFSSILPGSISNLTSLVTIDLSDNNFFGGFPLGFGEASGLKHLNASSNNFSGELPEDLGSGGDNNDSVLETLDFRGSFFEGSVPRSWMNLKRLKFLGLSGNNLTGNIPPEIGQLRSLERIILGYNEFEGEIPKELGNLTELRYLDFAVGSLSGAIPAELGKLKKLTTIYLFGNTFTGNIPPEIGNASALVYLDLSDNQLSGKIPDEIAQLKNLQLLNLMRNQLSGPIPSEIGNKLTKLQVLELWQNSLTGSLPEKLGTNSPLQWLDVSSNLLSGEIPGGLCDSGNLTKLIFFNNSFSGSLPGSLSRCSSLVRVRGQDNHISGTIPVGLGNLPKLQRLELGNNNLTGEIPHDFTSSMSLSFIDVSSNYLESSLPSSIFAMPSIQTFVASNNRLEGDLPSQFQDSPCLSVLDLSFNHFSGEIPGSIASCEKLVTLNLSHNELTGHIPKSMANMPTLSVLDLSNNSLVGRIPESFGSSPALETLDLSYNRLEGPVPNNGILMTINANDLTGNHGLCGGVLSPCSTQTTSEGMRSSRAAHVHRLVIGLALGVSAILGFAMVVFTGRWLYRRWFLLGDGLFWDCMFGKSNNLEWPWRLISFQRLSFTGADIMACLKESNVIGMGGSGIVYKAQPHGHSPAVAVKKLWRTEVDEDIEKCGGAAASDELFVEVNLLGRLRHRNIVRLLGYLHNESDVMMVYEYMPNGNLGEALHGKQSGKVLVDWVSRYNVAVGVAYGLAYLHHDCRPPVIHRDIKSNNILLDEKFEARIADFGLARTMLRKNETVSMVAGSYGYIAPEYGYSLKVDEKSDIYSFGVVLLELLTGKQPLDPEFGDSSDIVDWVCTRINKRAAEETLDPEIAGQCKHVQEEMLLVLRIALVCTAKLPKDRPSMRDVITMLGEAKPRRKSICESRVYTSSTNKEQPIFSNSPVSGLL